MDWEIEPCELITKELIGDYVDLLTQTNSILSHNFSLTLKRNYFRYVHVVVEFFVEQDSQPDFEFSLIESMTIQFVDVLEQIKKVVVEKKIFLSGKPPRLKLRFRVTDVKDKNKTIFSELSHSFRVIEKTKLIEMYRGRRYKFPLRERETRCFLYKATVRFVPTQTYPFIYPNVDDIGIRAKIIEVYPRKGPKYGGQHVHVYFNLIVNRYDLEGPMMHPGFPNLVVYFDQAQSYPISIRPNRIHPSRRFKKANALEWVNCRRMAMYCFSLMTPAVQTNNNAVVDIHLKYLTPQDPTPTKLTTLEKCYIYTDPSVPRVNFANRENSNRVREDDLNIKYYNIDLPHRKRKKKKSNLVELVRELEFVSSSTIYHVFLRKLFEIEGIEDEANTFSSDYTEEEGEDDNTPTIMNGRRNSSTEFNSQQQHQITSSERKENSPLNQQENNHNNNSSSSSSHNNQQQQQQEQEQEQQEQINPSTSRRKLYRSYFEICDMFGFSLMHHFFYRGEVYYICEMMRYNIERIPEMLTMKDHFGNTPIHCCNFLGHPILMDWVRARVKENKIPVLEIRRRNGHGCTPERIPEVLRVYEVFGSREIALVIGDYLDRNEQMKFSQSFRFFHSLRDFRSIRGRQKTLELRMNDDGLLPLKEWELQDLQFVFALGVGNYTRVYLAYMKLPIPYHLPKYYACKVIPKCETIRLKQVNHIKNEKKNLVKCRGGPFMNYLYRTFQDGRNIYMLLDFAQGNELFYHLRFSGRFTESRARFFAAEIMVAFEYLHDRNIIYRDLKPENVMLDSEGHVKLIDFGFSKEVEKGEKTWSIVGTPDYLAPEVIQTQGHSKPVDWWCLGILLFEMLAGYPPFYSPTQNVMDIYTSALSGVITFPVLIKSSAKDLITKLLHLDPSKRLGSGKDGVREVMAHPFFEGMNWDQVRNRGLEPPIKVVVSSPRDLRYFRSRFCRARGSVPRDINYFDLSQEEQKVFKDF